MKHLKIHPEYDFLQAESDFLQAFVWFLKRPFNKIPIEIHPILDYFL